MDLVVFGGLMVFAGYYVNNGSFEAFQPRSLLARRTLPENEILQADDNIYHTTMLERAQAELQSKADKQFPKLQAQKKEFADFDISNIQKGVDDDDAFVLESGNGIIDTFNLVPFEGTPDVLPNRGANANVVSQQLRREQFVAGDTGVPGQTDRTSIAEWNGPDALTIPEFDGINIARKDAVKVLSNSRNGELSFEQQRERPILEREMRIMPKTSDELRGPALGPKNNFQFNRLLPETVVHEAPIPLPTLTSTKQSKFDFNGFFARNAVAPNSKSNSIGVDTRTLKPDLESTFGVGMRATAAYDKAPVYNPAEFKVRANSNRHYNPLTFAHKTSLYDKTPLRNTKVPLTHKSQLQYNTFGNVDNQRIGRLDSRNTPQPPQITQKEMLNRDGILHSNVTGPYTRQSYDVSNVVVPPTNKENNLIEYVGAPTVSNALAIPDVETIREGIRPTSVIDTSGHVMPAEAPVSASPLFTDEIVKRVSGVREYANRVPIPLIANTDQINIGEVRAREEMDVPTVLRPDFSAIGMNYDLEDAAKKFEQQARKPRKFF